MTFVRTFRLIVLSISTYPTVAPGIQPLQSAWSINVDAEAYTFESTSDDERCRVVNLNDASSLKDAILPRLRNQWVRLQHGVSWTFGVSRYSVRRGQALAVCIVFRNDNPNPATVNLPFRPEQGFEAVLKDSEGTAIWRNFEGTEPDLIKAQIVVPTHGARAFHQNVTFKATAGRVLLPGDYWLYVALKFAPDSTALAYGPPPIRVTVK